MAEKKPHRARESFESTVAWQPRLEARRAVEAETGEVCTDEGAPDTVLTYRELVQRLIGRLQRSNDS